MRIFPYSKYQIDVRWSHSARHVAEARLTPKQLHMDALGSFPRKTLRTGQFISTYFDSEFRFIYQERNENLNRVWCIDL